MCIDNTFVKFTLSRCPNQRLFESSKESKETVFKIYLFFVSKVLTKEWLLIALFVLDYHEDFQSWLVFFNV